ncbi:MAG TPA: hypothetical protein VGO40_16355, partial [Longimicrobium sp.]|nr:hypothetical protein [Longimicrobium sp.]
GRHHLTDRRDQELGEITEKSAAAAALLKREPAAPTPSLGREDVATLALMLAEYAFLEREAKRLMLEGARTRIHVRKYEVVGVELPCYAFTFRGVVTKTCRAVREPVDVDRGRDAGALRHAAAPAGAVREAR